MTTSSAHDFADRTDTAVIRKLPDTNGASHWAVILYTSEGEVLHTHALRADKNEEFYEGVLAEASPWLNRNGLTYGNDIAWRGLSDEEDDAFIAEVTPYKGQL